jgi:hypothetical protein
LRVVAGECGVQPGRVDAGRGSRMAMPANALAGIIERRRTLLITNVWAPPSVAALTCCTFAGITSPAILFALTFGVRSNLGRSGSSGCGHRTGAAAGVSFGSRAERRKLHSSARSRSCPQATGSGQSRSQCEFLPELPYVLCRPRCALPLARGAEEIRTSTTTVSSQVLCSWIT